MIANAWKVEASGGQCQRLVRQIVGTRRALSYWNIEVFGFCEKKLEALHRDLTKVQNEQLSQDNLEKETSIQLEILEIRECLDEILQ